jgi:hypothetical protein
MRFSPSSLARDFGLLESEASRLVDILDRHIPVTTPRAKEDEQRQRQRLLAETNANLAIENLSLAWPEVAFFHYIQQFALPPADADAIHLAYSMARARSVTALAAE